MHCVVGRLGIFLYGFLFGFEAFFRWFVILILHWFNHEEPALLTAMFAAPRGSDGSRGGNRPRYGWLGSDPCPPCIMVQSFFPDMSEGNYRHKGVRLPCFDFSANFWL
ncbi:hypothetical protein B296_00028035 [Ensete ventricosum]|uniref:Uncharacterized protein n=1 Tax=Ensete ventricosum TaxID=4639 RepID=A0A426YSU9_ENSVE|nr:hypothetical protein B296_00028035 [Ensete ventricosum]